MTRPSRAFVIAGLLAAIGAAAPVHAQVFFVSAAPADDDHCFLSAPASPVLAPQQFVWTDLLGLLGGINIRIDDSGRGAGGVDNESLRRANSTLDSCDRKLDRITELLETKLNKHDAEIAELARKQEQTTQALDQRITETTTLVKQNAEQIKSVTALISGNTELIENLQYEIRILQPLKATHTVNASAADVVKHFKKADGTGEAGEFTAAVDVEVLTATGDFHLVKFKKDAASPNEITYVAKGKLTPKPANP
jgi:hypothetical protein